MDSRFSDSAASGTAGPPAFPQPFHRGRSQPLSSGTGEIGPFCSSAQTSITSVDLAITRVAQQRGDLGAYQNRLAFTIRSTENAVENIQASESSIRDADIAAEVSAFTRAQILVQSGTALLAQANVLPQNALSLLG